MCEEEVQRVLMGVHGPSMLWLEYLRDGDSRSNLAYADMMEEVRLFMNKMEPRLSDADYARIIVEVLNQLSKTSREVRKWKPYY